MMMVGCVQGEMLRYDMKPSEIRKLENEKSGANEGHQQVKTFKHKLIYPSGNEWHEGYIDDIYILGQQQERSKSHALDGFIGKKRKQFFFGGERIEGGNICILD